MFTRLNQTVELLLYIEHHIFSCHLGRLRTLLLLHLFYILIITAIFRVSEYLGHLC